ncbi:MAG TPA: flagellar export protein FliJ [Patescibacteria group bacterium]|nr:flagellar export protein FliJ [Patescibacteria group bacterium]
MKPFRFSLQPIRALKQQVEESARQRYALTLRACEEAAARVQQASMELTECWSGLCQKLSAGVNSAELLRARAWCNVLELRVKERALALENARLAVDAVWQELMTVTREREGLDRLHDRRKACYHRQAQAAEQKVLDELALQMTHFPVTPRALATITNH